MHLLFLPAGTCGPFPKNPNLLRIAIEFIGRFQRHGPAIQRRMANQADNGLQTDMTTGAAYESEAFGLCFATEDQKDAMKAFLNKEKVTAFKNR